MTAIGLDADTVRLAYCGITDGSVAGVGTIERLPKSGEIPERYDLVLAVLMKRAAALDATIYLEGIWLPQDRSRANVQGFRALAEVQGEILAMARWSGARVQVVQPTVWQSKVLGITRGRTEIKKAAQRIATGLTKRVLSEHESDAVCLAMYGHGLEAGNNGTIIPFPKQDTCVQSSLLTPDDLKITMRESEAQ